MEIIHLAQDELEALYLCDGEGMTQEEAGVCMGVSRGTVQRLLAAARSKIAKVIIGKKALAISGNTPGKKANSGSVENIAKDLHCTGKGNSQ